MMIFSKLRSLIKGFKRDDDGSVAIETVILVPMLFWVFLSTLSIFHAYRQHAISQKAGYTIADMISRETEPIDRPFMIGAQKVFQFLSLSELQDTTLRVSVAKYDLTDNKYEMLWSKVQGNAKVELTDAGVAALGDRLPIMKNDEQIIIVETWIDYDPPFDTGLATHDVVNFIFTRPRYAPNICWDQCGG
jgi:Flp pilus assembly protein TadG